MFILDNTRYCSCFIEYLWDAIILYEAVEAHVILTDVPRLSNNICCSSLERFAIRDILI
jgi:hypothetical protein